MNQSAYDNGIIRQTKKVQAADALVEEQKLEVELYKLRERINQIFFVILIIDEQKVQVEFLLCSCYKGLIARLHD